MHNQILRELRELRVEVVRLGRYSKERFDQIMSKISDFSGAVQANFDKVSADLDAIGTDIKALNDQIAALQASPGALTAEDQASLDKIQAAGSALQAKADAAVPAPLPAPPAA